ncbi:Hypothetical Protein FCC1311_063942 [Hondaea fermentalgiana]|uniref:Uncharacterized protein n=1 Tax=Hondaea fermentalgiana TaxID=2315210 RepID=A0A2R5GQM1_9STRA|nr:Hypothetical Protein FCC1311_063942 [Hondaea fermentalgiana]|eukprot:GBG30174.1 Hypothetical Protein FCC1311_063942 [Hondaea fermentalgiana]
MGSKKTLSKFQPSRPLEQLLLELAGVKPGDLDDDAEPAAATPSTTTTSATTSPARKRSRSTSSSTGGTSVAANVGPRRAFANKKRRPEQDVDTLMTEARRLKHLGDKTEEPAKYMLYVRSSLKCMEACQLYILDSPVEKQVELLSNTAELLEFSAKRCLSKCRKALHGHNLGLLRRYAFTAALAHRLAATTRMARFAVKADKLSKVWMGIDATQAKIQRADHLRSTGVKVSATESPAFYVTPEEHSHLTQQSAFVLAEARDSVLGMELWQCAEQLEEDIANVSAELAEETLGALPDIGIMRSSTNLLDAVDAARQAIREDSTRFS